VRVDGEVVAGLARPSRHFAHLPNSYCSISSTYVTRNDNCLKISLQLGLVMGQFCMTG